VKAPDGYPVHNLNTGLNYTTIQEAIDAPVTSDGNTIFVEKGVYIENVTVDKSISLIGEDRNSTIIDGNYSAPIVMNMKANNVTVSGFTIQNGKPPPTWRDDSYGIYISSSYNNISRNIVANNTIAIGLYSSNSSTISENTVESPYYWGIYMFFCNDNNVTGNTIASSNIGIALDGDYSFISQGNVISYNTIWSNVTAIWLHMSAHNEFLENTALDCSYCGVDASYSPSNTFANNTISTVKADAFSGFYMSSYCENNIVDSNIISGFGTAGILITDYNTTVIRNDFINNTNGILLGGSGSTISGNTVSNNDFGLAFQAGGSDNIISNNMFSSNDWGMKLNGGGCMVYGNRVVSNYNVGISIEASDMILRNNTVADNKYNFGVIGTNYLNDVDVSNIVDGRPIYYWVNKDHLDVPINAGYLALINSTDITIRGLNIGSNIQGILLVQTRNSSITFSNLNHNMIGLQFEQFSLNNSVSENTIANNTVGIRVSLSAYNLIFHNNFIDNENSSVIDAKLIDPPNSWDDGYPSGGNYWSDYQTRYPSATDANSGPYQNIPGSDGIWDAPYVIDGSNRDNYPIVPEFSSLLILPLFMIISLLFLIILHKYRRKALKAEDRWLISSNY
jgi:parallel beta-helix repeat protein